MKLMDFFAWQDTGEVNSRLFTTSATRPGGKRRDFMGRYGLGLVLGEAEADCMRDKARRRVVPGYGEEAQRGAAGNTAGIDKPVWPNTL